LLFATRYGFAGDTGKISGHVRSNNGDPLPGATVMLVGTSQGASTDLNGDYTILHIRPGVYDVKVSMVGYQTAIEEGVRVEADRTIFLDFTLKEAGINVEPVVVTAQREVIKQDVSATQYTFTPKQAQVMPVNTIQDVLSYQLGVSVSGDNITVRGGGSSQVNFLLNDISLRDAMFNRPYMALNMTDISEIQVITSGFDAEYGNIRSGLVKVITKKGERDFHLSLDYKMLPYHQKYEGPNVFSPGYRDNIIYNSPVSMDSARLAEMFPYESKTFYGWPSVSKSLLTDNDPTNDLTPKQAQELWAWQYRGLPVRHLPDQYLDATISGPLPLKYIPGITGDLFDETTFVLSHRFSWMMFPTPSVRDNFNDGNTQLELTSKISKNLTLSATGLWGYEHGVGSSTVQGTLDVLRSGGSAYGNSDVPLADLYTTLYALKGTHFLSQATYYEVQFSYMNRKYNEHHGPLRDTTLTHEVPADWWVLGSPLSVPGYWDYATGRYVNQKKTFIAGDSLWVPAHWYDESPYGWVVPGPAYPSIDGRTNLDASNGDQDSSYGTSLRFRFDLTSQINHQNMIKTGFELNYDEFHRRFSETNWKGVQKIIYDDYPYQGAVYVENRYERKGLVANVGVRLDYFAPNGVVLSPGDPFSPYFSNITNFYDSLASGRIPKGSTRSTLKISPRVGVSFPISVSSKAYFNYGHFYSPPETQYLFGYLNSRSGPVEQISNPNLDMPCTIAYEFGYEQGFGDVYLHADLYYKDITNQVGTISYQNADGTISYVTFANSNYQDVIGAELRLTKSYGEFITGWIQTQFFGSQGGYVGQQIFYPPGSSIRPVFYEPEQPGKFLWNWIPSFLANIDIHTPDEWGPAILGTKLLAGWRFNIIQSWAEGAPFTWNPQNDPRIVNNLRWVNSYRTDIKISKSFKLRGKGAAVVYLDIRNLFPHKVLNPGALHGPPDNPSSEYYQYFQSLIPGRDRVGDYRADHIVYPKYTPGWTVFYDPNGVQEIYLGVRMDI